MGVISNPLGLGHPLPLSFFLLDEEEFWTAKLQLLPATWPIKKECLTPLIIERKRKITYRLLFYFSL